MKKKFISKVQEISFSGDYAIETEQEIAYITECAVFKLTSEGIILTEIAPGINLQSDILDQMEFRPIISPELKEMDFSIFKHEKMGLKI